MYVLLYYHIVNQDLTAGLIIVSSDECIWYFERQAVTGVYENVCDFYCDKVTVDLVPAFIIKGNAHFPLGVVKIRMPVFPHSSSQILFTLDPAPRRVSTAGREPLARGTVSVPLADLASLSAGSGGTGWQSKLDWALPLVPKVGTPLPFPSPRSPSLSLCSHPCPSATTTDLGPSSWTTAGL